MRKYFFLISIMLISLNIQAAHANNNTKLLPPVNAQVYNPHSFQLVLDHRPQGYYNSYATVIRAAYEEMQRKACKTVQIYENGTEIFLHRQAKMHRTYFLPWHIEVKPGTKALYMNISWIGEAQVALITPKGKRLSQKDFGKLYTNILTNYAHEGEDLLMLDPEPGIWEIWVLGKFNNASISVPRIYNTFTSSHKIENPLDTLTFATYWESKFFEDFTPAKFLLADSLGNLYPMQSYKEKILSEHRGYNGLAMQIQKPSIGTWELITLVTNPNLNQASFQVVNKLQKPYGKLTKVEFNKGKMQYLFYWQATPADSLQKNLFLSILPIGEKRFNNLLIPLTKNPQVIPAGMLPYAFSYKYYITSPYSMGEDGLLQGPKIINQN